MFVSRVKSIERSAASRIRVKLAERLAKQIINRLSSFKLDNDIYLPFVIQYPVYVILLFAIDVVKIIKK